MANKARADMTIGCVQLNSGPDVDSNLREAEKWIRQSVAQGAEFVLTPENTDFMREHESLMLETAKPIEGNTTVQFFSDLAAELKIWILVGSLKIKISKSHVVNRSFLFNPAGDIVTDYDKIHLFDVDLPDGERYRESACVQGGAKAISANVDGHILGLSICYDIRFPHLYRDLAKAGAQMIAIPAAFSQMTGRDHWEVLLRARAIETGCFVLAPAQCGSHEGGRKTHGHSMIISPWGTILSEIKDDNPGFINETINFEAVSKARQAIPSLQHDKNYEFKKTTI